MSEMALRFYATGRRKTATARVYLKSGTGRFLVNRRPLEEYFGRDVLKMLVMSPFAITNTISQFDVLVNVAGGGPTGQAGAIRHGLSRALLKVNAEFRDSLKRQGFLTRDAREKERQKYGQRGARARYQFSKR
jgi:small subunit ribosomal protein S9